MLGALGTDVAMFDEVRDDVAEVLGQLEIARAVLEVELDREEEAGDSAVDEDRLGREGDGVGLADVLEQPGLGVDAELLEVAA